MSNECHRFFICSQFLLDLFATMCMWIHPLLPSHLIFFKSIFLLFCAIYFLQADWSEQFVFNVHARSISPCDPHSGISVLFEYPACILDRADRIRLFGKLRADVASLAPPTSLHYITEQRVVRGQHALHFECDFFSEKYVEYCFVYVSQAISGAVADVRMDCLPTLPVRGKFLSFISFHFICFAPIYTLNSNIWSCFSFRCALKIQWAEICYWLKVGLKIMIVRQIETCKRNIRL